MSRMLVLAHRLRVSVARLVPCGTALPVYKQAERTNSGLQIAVRKHVPRPELNVIYALGTILMQMREVQFWISQ